MLSHKKALVSFLLIIIISSYTNPVKGSVTWSEEFTSSSLNNWNISACSSNDIWGSPCDNNNTTLSVINGALTAPDTTEFTHVSRAFHNSSVAYGTWEFDWTVGHRNKSFDAVEFAFTDYKHEYNWANINPSAKNWTGYALVMVSWEIPSWSGSNGPGLHLMKFTNTYSNFAPVTVETVKFNETISGTHHIEIVRDTNGGFEIQFDSEVVISDTDNTHKTSEMFAFASWLGDSSIDNITVSSNDTTTSDPPNTSESSTDGNSTNDKSTEDNSPLLSWFIPSIAILVLVRKRFR